jgi:glycosyltransferase involved in cell wall biosynthesis
MEHDLRILICTGSTGFDSVSLLFRHLEIACAGIAPAVKSPDLPDAELAACLQAGCVILGWDERVFRMRKELGAACPALLPSYGIGTRGLLTLFEFGELLTLEDRFFCPSLRDGIAAEVHWGGAESPFVCLPYAVEPPERIDREEARARLGIGKYEILLAIVGRINRQKNIDCGLKTVAQLVAGGISATLLIIGAEDASGYPELGWSNTGCLDELKRLAGELGVSGSVRWMGSLERRELAWIYAALDWNLTFSTFRTEDFGYVPLEAASYGVPTIGTKWGGLWDTVFDLGIGNRMDVFTTAKGWAVDWYRAVDVILWARGEECLEGMRRWLPKAVAANYGMEIFAVRLRLLVHDAARHLGTPPRWLNALQLENLSPEVGLFWEQLNYFMERGAELDEARRGSLTPATALPLFSAYYSGRERRILTQDSVLYQSSGVETELLKFYDGRNSLREVGELLGEEDPEILELATQSFLDDGLLMFRSVPEFPPT